MAAIANAAAMLPMLPHYLIDLCWLRQAIKKHGWMLWISEEKGPENGSHCVEMLGKRTATGYGLLVTDFDSGLAILSDSLPSPVDGRSALASLSR